MAGRRGGQAGERPQPLRALAIELQHVSAERGGTLKLLIAGEEQAARAAEVLAQQGYYDVVVSPVLEDE